MSRLQRLALVGILATAAGLRFWGLTYGLPHPVTRPDEELIVGRALQLSLGRIREPGVFDYPHLVYYIDALVLWSYRGVGRLVGVFHDTDDFLTSVAVRQPGLQYLVCRSTSAILGIATVLATYGAAWHAYRRRSVALLATLLVGVNFLHARDSHFATVDVPMTLFVTLAILFAARAAGTQSRRDVLLSAVFAGLATSAKYNAGVVILCPVMAIAHRLLHAPRPRRLRDALTTLALAGVVMASTFAVTSPYCVVRFGEVLKGLQLQERALFGFEGGPAWRIHLRTTLPGAFGWPGFIAALAGLGRAAWKRRPADLVLLAFLVPTFGSMAGMTWVVPRYTLPMLPALAILAAETTLSCLPLTRPAWAGIGVLGLALHPLWNIVSYDRLAAREDTRLQAAKWVAENLPPRSRVALCKGYGAPAINDDHRRPPAFKPQWVPCTIDAIRETGARHVVIHDHPYVRAFRPTRDVVTWLEADGRLLATFDPFRAGAGATPYFFRDDAFYLPYSGFAGVERGGPIVTIWELPDH